MAKEIDTREYMAEFLAAGKNVTTIPAGQRTDPENIQMKFMGGRPKKVAEPKVEKKPKK